MTTPPAPRVTPVAATPEAKIPRLSWDEVSAQLDVKWIPKEAPHHSVIGLTGSGKSYLVTRGLMPMIAYDRALIIDVKGDDPTLAGYGKVVKAHPHQLVTRGVERKKKRVVGDNWYRLRVSSSRAEGREQVKKALAQVYKEGRWFVIVDETRYLTDPRDPSLGVRSFVEQLWMRGRSKEVSLVAMTQSPKWVPSSFYDQPSFVWIGRVNDEDAQKRLREVGGLSKAHLPVIASLKKREFLLVAEGGDFQAITGL